MWTYTTPLAHMRLFASGVVAPINGAADLEGCRWEPGGEVTTPAGYRAAYRAFVDAGRPALACDPAVGGQDLPQLLNAALYEMLSAANHAWTMYPGLLHGACECLKAQSSDELKARCLPKIVGGEWLATMVPTEPHAGSDLGAVRTRGAGPRRRRLARRTIGRGTLRRRMDPSRRRAALAARDGPRRDAVAGAVGRLMARRPTVVSSLLPSHRTEAAMDTDNLIAIHVHTHAEVSCWNPFDNYGEEYDRAAAKYFRSSKRPTIAGSIDHYRERRIGMVMFMVDAEAQTGRKPLILKANAMRLLGLGGMAAASSAPPPAGLAGPPGPQP